MAKFYVWSTIHNGGEVGEVESPTGQKKTVLLSRNTLDVGSEISKAKSGLSDEEWDAMIEGGSIRPYPLPEGADEYTSPTQAVIRALTTESGEIDQNMLLELALSQPLPRILLPRKQRKLKLSRSESSNNADCR